MIEYDYTDFHLSMDCFWCEVVSGDLILLEVKRYLYTLIK